VQKQKDPIDVSLVKEIQEKDKKYVWHHMAGYNPASQSSIYVEGDGAWLTDLEGNRFLDAMSGLWCVNVGYHQPSLAEAAKEQMNKLPFYPMIQSHLPAIQLAEKLNEWLGGDYVIFFSNSGSEANEVAFKVTRQYYKQKGEGNRFKFLSRYRAYHGNSMGALSATGQADRKNKFEPLVEGFKHVNPPDCYRCPFGQTYGSCQIECAKDIDHAIQMEGEESIAGVIMEPVITGGGIIVPPEEYVKEVEAICNRRGILLIIDEVICGFGRSGEKFGHQNFGIKPDIVTMAKGITSGYLPLSATAVKREIYEAFELWPFQHLNTFGGNPVACQVALKNLELIEEQNLVERSKYLGVRLRERLSSLVNEKHVGDLRQFGFLLGIELVEDQDNKTPMASEKIQHVVAACKKKGLIIGKNGDTAPGYGNVLTICPPFVVTDEELEFICATVEESIKNLS
jgi:taurine-pyruvate aminotransferase